jgi:hypothetical protein
MNNNSTNFEKSLLFLHVNELREIATKLSLTEKGNKMALIQRICHFLTTGEKLTVVKFPKESCAQRGKTYPIGDNELMLKGAYKNDYKTRLFFKRIIGPHFHFTAYGIDWLNKRWSEGRPPTYREFAKMWEQEHQKRKKAPVSPKKEWAYINFVQEFLSNYPSADQESIHQAWNAERLSHKAKVYQYIEAVRPFDP